MHGSAGILAFGLVALGVMGGSPDDSQAREVRRIRSHFDSVLVELASADVAGLDSGALARRAALQQTLAAYRDRGAFPRNYHFAEPTPYFVDRKTGLLCAVGHLMASTGRRDLVDRIAAANNNVRVAELARDTAVASWLVEHGITLAEAARIQPEYCFFGCPPPEPPPPPTLNVRAYSDAAKAGASVAAAAVLLNLVTNRDASGQGRTALGFVAGGVSIVAGGLTMAVNEARSPVGARSVATGAVSIAVSTWLDRKFRYGEVERARRLTMSVRPTLPASSGRSAGMAVNLRF